MNFDQIAVSPTENEVLRLEYEITELNYRLNNWDLIPSTVVFWTSIVSRMQARLDALRAGDAKTTG